MDAEGSLKTGQPTMKTQYLALLGVSLVQFGDAVEMFLPSVITQPVSCELGLSPGQEYILALALYISLGIFVIVTVPFSDTFGRRPVILFAIYISIGTTLVCSIVPNYTTLLISRILLGLSIAVNISTVSVYMSEVSTGGEFRVAALTVASTAFTVGGGWCGLLGYFFLEQVGWRYFILLTSIPLFIIPLILFQFYLPESKDVTVKQNNERILKENTKPLLEDGEELVYDTMMKCEPPPKDGWFVARMLGKHLTYCTFHGIIYFGAILFVPSVYEVINSQDKTTSDVAAAVFDPCVSIHGTQFLTISILFGACHLLGRGLSFVSRRILSPVVLIISASFVTMVVMILAGLHPHNHTLVFVALGISQTVYSAAVTETYVQCNDSSRIPQKYLGLVSASYNGYYYIILAVTSTLSVLMKYEGVLQVHAVSGFIALLASFLFLIHE